jgi:hypothetical protein
LDEIVEIMARADVDYFWQEGGTRFDNFEKPIAVGVRLRMASIVKALSIAGYSVRKNPATGEWPNAAETIRTVGNHAATDAIEIIMLIALLRGKHDATVTAELKEAGAAEASAAVENGLIARLVTLTARAYADPRPGDMHVAVAAELLKGEIARQIFSIGDDGAKLAAFDAQWIKCRGDHRRKLVEEFRDKYTAHLGEPKEVKAATYSDVYGFAAETARAMDNLALATGAIVRSTLDDNPTLSAAPAAFWNRWK